ncbi:3-phosphoshikimate 1-carboxyvinyltransferase [hydrothermal vent metagenome]|uniref:3-phosphoshikimate 1-carboxyvinyltransferase n=1 Tax=hydrothermal vent metagenome TaxID=652676 RepID=A0A3B0UW58_9ZZZZ
MVNQQITVPGDKSISHRSMILAGIADGITEITGFLESADCVATMQAMQSMGVKIEKQNNHYLVHGVGKYGLQRPDDGQIDCGNSGTGMRLLSGIMAAQPFDSVISGDKSLNTRPMTRIITPLTMMGATVTATAQGTAPLRFNPVANLRAIHYQTPVASAQIKSCVLLAGLYSDGEVKLTEPKLSRDHTENMLRGFGCELQTSNLTTTMFGGQTLTATAVVVPADISSAAFFMVLASLLDDAEITFNNLCINPSRAGVINILQLMGADIICINQRMHAGEQIADVVVKSSKLTGIEIPNEFIAAAIDEFPVIFIAAACASGQTKLSGAMELRKKESDRIRVMATGLQTLGINCHELDDGLIINGGELTGGVVNSDDDHRCAMSFLIAGQFASQTITVKNCENIMTSFPNFLNICHDLGLKIS